jgi:pilus assembly protein CpaD
MTSLKSTLSPVRKRTLVAGALVGAVVALGGCKHTDDGPLASAAYPADYRERHPIAVTEADRAVIVFVGKDRGGLSASQRADVTGMAQSWLHEGTGAITIDMPVDTPNARAARDSLREIQATFSAAGLPSNAVKVRQYRPQDSRYMAAIRVRYPKFTAVAGPCGLWPEDLGPSIHNPSYFGNQDYYNFGCANQRNIAAMIDDPTDLVQPRAETPPYTARRSEAFKKYREGNTTATSYPESDKAKLSATGN